MEDGAYNTVTNNPELAAGGGGGSGEVSDNNDDANRSIEMKRKRGRPRKLPAEAQPVMVKSSPLVGFPSPTTAHPPPKRGRGRPRGSGKPRLAPASPPGSAEEIYGYGVDLMPHILAIYQGEDVHERILSFAQSGSRGISVLSCNGPVSRVSICSPGSAGGMIYQGWFEILTLNGTFTCVENEGSYHRRGMLTVSLAKPNGEVFGGCVSGPIIAAGPIQLILCSFDQLRRVSETQFRNCPVPNFPDATPPSAVGQVTAAKASGQFQEASQDQDNSPLKSDPVSINAPIFSDPEPDPAFAPSLLTPGAEQPQADAEDQVNAASVDQ